MVDVLVTDSLGLDLDSCSSEFDSNFECLQLPQGELVLFELDDIKAEIFSNVSIVATRCIHDIDFCWVLCQQDEKKKFVGSLHLTALDTFNEVKDKAGRLFSMNSFDVYLTSCFEFHGTKCCVSKGRGQCVVASWLLLSAKWG